MVRGVSILLIMTVISQILTRSVFDQFTTPDKKDKNKMLLYLRGMMKPEGTTTVKVTTQQYDFTPPLDSLTVKQVWEGKGLPDRSDKSKMLAYLRGMNGPNSLSIYEDPQHRGVIQSLETQNTENKQNTADIKPSFKTSDRQVLWGNAAAVTQPTILQPEEKKDNQFKMSFGGGNNMKYDNIDDFILNIIDKESSESFDTSAPVKSKIHTEDKYEIVVPDTIRNPFIFAPPTKNSKKKAPSKLLDKCRSEILKLKKKKLQLEIDKLKRQNYKLDLELLKLEKEMGITRPSTFTLPLYLHNESTTTSDITTETSDTD